MTAKVVDASTLAAVIFDEPEADMVAGRLRGVQLVAPALLTYEIVNVCAIRLRRHPMQRAAILAAFHAYQSLAFDLTDVDPLGVLEFAERSGLTAMMQPLCGSLDGSTPNWSPWISNWRESRAHRATKRQA